MRDNAKHGLTESWRRLSAQLGGAGESIVPLMLRLVLGWEFWEAGVQKFRGENWFGDVRHAFPFPFDVIPADASWLVATWFELIGAVMLWLGLGTRFFAFALMFLTFVATAAVHWPDGWATWGELLKGYSVSDHGYGNFKLPLLFAVMLLPLVFSGAGRLSGDYLLASRMGSTAEPRAAADAQSWALACAVLGIPTMMLVPRWGLGLLVLAFVFAARARLGRAWVSGRSAGP